MPKTWPHQYAVRRILSPDMAQAIALTLNISLKTVSNCHYLIKNKLHDDFLIRRTTMLMIIAEQILLSKRLTTQLVADEY